MTPKFQADFLKLLIRQLIAFVQRDIRDALDMVGGIYVLPVIASYQLSPTAITQYPAILMVPDKSEFVREAVGTLQSVSSLLAIVGVQHQDPEVLSELVQDYVRAVDMIFNSLPLSDFYASWPISLRILGNTNAATNSPAGLAQTTALRSGTVKDLFVSAHVYDEVRRQKQGFACAASLMLVVDREEA